MTRGMFLANIQCLGSNLQQKDTLRKSATLVYPSQVQVIEFYLYHPSPGPIVHDVNMVHQRTFSNGSIDTSVQRTETNKHTLFVNRLTLCILHRAVVSKTFVVEFVVLARNKVGRASKFLRRAKIVCSSCTTIV